MRKTRLDLAIRASLHGSPKPIPTRHLGAAALVAALGLGYGASAAATTYIVNTTGDPGPGGTQSLRQAIVTANGSTGNTIQFDAALTGSTITLAGNYIAIVQPMTISGPGADKLTISGNDALRIFLVEGGGLVTISGLTLTHGHPDAPLHGGAIGTFSTPLSVQNCVISGNAAVDGGGIWAQDSDLTVANSVISGNSAGFLGGGIGASCAGGCGNLSISQSVISGNSAGQSGAGVYAYKQHGVSVSQSQISGNRNPGPGGQAGGGLLLYATQTTPVISNSTIAGNFSYSRAGGVYADSATFSFTTIAGNSTHASDGNGLQVFGIAAVTLQDSILANNFSTTSTVDVVGNLTANFSLIRNAGSATVGGTNKLIGLDPQLSTLANHGGPTLTMVPAAGSPAVDGGEASLPPTLDQRGLSRPVGAKADMGAVERQVVEDIIFRDGFNTQ